MILEPIIGLEIHVQLKTQSKMFCGCVNVVGEAQPNSAICSVCTAQPGALPVPNAAALELGLKAALALGMKINTITRFDRKNYFYPDLPKGYQITQFHSPVGTGGQLSFLVNDTVENAHFERVHLEEDAAKLLHRGDATLIDFNRAGTPLAEFVTTPEFHSAAQASAFVQELQLLLRRLRVSDADMEKGQLRVDANISLRPVGDTKLYPKTEIKNLNSFRALERALISEIERQATAWEAGTPPAETTTRGWDEATGATVQRREKEAAHDYRYFPEPDIPPIEYSDEQIARLRAELPEQPQAQRQRFQEQYGFTLQDATVLVGDPALAAFAEASISEFKAWLEAQDAAAADSVWHARKPEIAKLVANWLTQRLVPAVGRTTQDFPGKVHAEAFAHLVRLLDVGDLTPTAAQSVLELMVQTGADPEAVMREQGIAVIRGGEELQAIITRVLAAHPQEVARYKAGKTTLLQFLVGQVMRETKGTADATALAKALEEVLHSA